MLIQAKNVFLLGSRMVTPGEIVETDAQTGKFLINKSAAAEFAGNEPAAAPVPPPAAIPNGNIHDAEGGVRAPGGGENDYEDLTDDEDIPTYTTDMKMDEIRAAMRERGLAIRVGMTKAEMVKILNGEDDALPEITPQDVVEE